MHFVMAHFTIRLLKNINTLILRECVLSMLHMDQREKSNNALTSIKI